jgi:hypothetical protein
MCDFSKALKLCHAYSDEVATDEDADCIRVVLKDVNAKDLASRLLDVGFEVKSEHTLSNSTSSVVYRGILPFDYMEDDINDGEAPF